MSSSPRDRTANADTVPEAGAPDPDLTEAQGLRRANRSPRRGTLGIGTVISRYEIIGRLGDGGMGTVYAAHDPQLDRDVAIKILHTPSLEATWRLEREAQALAKLEHSNVVAVYDSGKHDEAFFIVMQLVHGENLAQELRLRPRSPSQIVKLFVDAGHGLAAAHDAGIIHRDFKPSNVLVNTEGRVAVTDFGLARGIADLTPDPESVAGAPASTTPGPRACWSDQQLTGVGTVMGTPAYMSPEQHQGAAVSSASDQFSFCVAVWEAIYGQHPFLTPEHGAEALGLAITDGRLVPPPPGSRVPKRVLAALTRGLAAKPAARWPTMKALLEQLAPPEQNRRGMIALAALLAAGTSGLAVWATTQKQAAPSCAVSRRARVDAVWSPQVLAAARRNFAATGKPFADQAATLLGERVAGYADAWQQLAVDDCLAERTSTTVDAELRVRRKACLDDALDDLRTLARVVSGPANIETVEHAGQLVDALPALAGCADADALRAGPGAPPAILAARVAIARQRLASARITYADGQLVAAEAQLTTLAPDVAAIGWAPLEVELGVLRGQLEVARIRPATEALISTAQRAVELRMDAMAASAWSLAMQSAALAHDASQQRTLEAVAIATARRSADPSLMFEVGQGRALSLRALRKWPEALAVCHELDPLVARIPTDQRRARADADECKVLSLVPLNRWSEAAPLIDRQLAVAGELYGADHPAVAALLSTRANLLERTGKIAEARQAYERALAIRIRALGPSSERVLDSLLSLMNNDMAAGNLDAAEARGRALLEELAKVEPPPLGLHYRLHRDLGMIAQQREDMPGAIRAFDVAIGYANQLAGPESLDAALLMIMSGQYKATLDVEAGITLLHRAGNLLDAVGDRRAAFARGAEAVVLYHEGRWGEAVPLYERALATVDIVNAEAGNVGRLHYQLARCLDALHRDPARVRELALLAREDFSRAGEPEAYMLGVVEKFLRAKGVTRLDRPK